MQFVAGKVCRLIRVVQRSHFLGFFGNKTEFFDRAATYAQDINPNGMGLQYIIYFRI